MQSRKVSSASSISNYPSESPSGFDTEEDDESQEDPGDDAESGGGNETRKSVESEPFEKPEVNPNVAVIDITSSTNSSSTSTLYGSGEEGLFSTSEGPFRTRSGSSVDRELPEVTFSIGTIVIVK